uniref:Putative head morphogenesis protein n=1 Tax=viral metagenome TaxID=1070528 RepID=A0A6M3IQM8_9ZZZZ
MAIVSRETSKRAVRWPTIRRSHMCQGGNLLLNRVLRRDPTFTMGISRSMGADAVRRLRQLKRDMRESIIDRDCFGIQPGALIPITNAPSNVREFAFTTAAKKLEGFMAWLERQEQLGILQLTDIMGTGRSGLSEVFRARMVGQIGQQVPWTNTYIHSAYAKGVTRSRAELAKAGYDVTLTDEIVGGLGPYLSGPIHAERLALLYTRTYEELKSVTAVMNSAIQRQIAQGLSTGLARGIAEGKNPSVIARELFNNTAQHIDKIGMVRCKMIARTEVIRAHHIANMSEYERAGVDGVDVEIEALTADVATVLGNPVCGECQLIKDNGPYPLTEAYDLFPAHPN